MPSEPRRPITVIIVAGGTGGHLFPARHIADAFKEDHPGNRVEFIGNGRPLEATIIDAKGYVRHVIASAGVKGLGIGGALRFIAGFPRAVMQCFSLYQRIKPDLVVGVGGYVTVVPLLVAALRGIPTIVHEAEIDPGMANAFLARFVTRITVAFQGATIGPRRKVVVTGQPVRAEMKRFSELKVADIPRPRRLLVIGGSLGAKAIDQAMASLAPFLAERELEVCHQTRPENLEGVRQAYAHAGLKSTVCSFIEAIDVAYEEADIIVARAGASTVAELAIVNKPVIFVPFPFAQGDHQTKNARVLTDAGKGVLVPEGKDFESRLRQALEQVLNPQNWLAMVRRSGASRSTDGAHRIAAAGRELVSPAK